MESITKSAEETKRLGQKIATDLVKKLDDKPIVVALEGELGAGKTTFSQGFASGLGIKSRIISPTFILMRRYEGKKDFYHVDLYRLVENVEREVENLGLKDVWNDPKNIVLIEWADKIKNILPKGTIRIKFEEEGENSRKITIDNL